ncbi:MAG: glycosyltransferase [Anaerolineales bacterium]|nr:glycosyltransferase [Anaerolineales bacterium]
MSTPPMISIITPSYNGAKYIKTALDSVAAQKYPRLEHIIVDGLSSDRTREIVSAYPEATFISSPDQGMYDALNKGLEAASGEIIGFLNTDDAYADDIFLSIAERFHDDAVSAVAGFAHVFLNGENGVEQIIDTYSPADKTLLECSTIGSNYFNAWFFRASVFKEIGRFNSEYRIAGDREFMFRFAIHRLRYVVFDRLVYRYRQHADSLTFNSSTTDQKRELSAQEHLKLTDAYLNDTRLPRSTKRLLAQLRTNETVDLVLRMLWNFDLSKCLFYFKEGLRYDLAWPLVFFIRVIQAFHRLAVKAARGRLRFLAGA